jgi:hypothetical protein
LRSQRTQGYTEVRNFRGEEDTELLRALARVCRYHGEANWCPNVGRAASSNVIDLNLM